MHRSEVRSFIWEFETANGPGEGPDKARNPGCRAAEFTEDPPGLEVAMACSTSVRILGWDGCRSAGRWRGCLVGRGQGDGLCRSRPGSPCRPSR
jgi:hypothetical protein